MHWSSPPSSQCNPRVQGTLRAGTTTTSTPRWKLSTTQTGSRTSPSRADTTPTCCSAGPMTCRPGSCTEEDAKGAGREEEQSGWMVISDNGEGGSGKRISDSSIWAPLRASGRSWLPRLNLGDGDVECRVLESIWQVEGWAEGGQQTTSAKQCHYCAKVKQQMARNVSIGCLSCHLSTNSASQHLDFQSDIIEEMHQNCWWNSGCDPKWLLNVSYGL